MTQENCTSTPKSRELLPARRQQETIHGKIGGQSFFLSFGEYADGSLGEVWLEAAKEGTFLRGIVGSLARSFSVAIQCGADLRCMVESLKGLNFPPNGDVLGDSGAVLGRCTSVVDWVAQEIHVRYCDGQSVPTVDAGGS